MPRGGNNRLPDAIAELRGTQRKPQRGRLAEGLELEPCQIPNAPKGTREDERQIWNDLRRILQPLGVVAEADLNSFRMMVRAYARAFRLLDDETADPGPAMDRALKWAVQFGLTPASRSTVRAHGGKPETRTLEDFLSVN